MAAGQGLVFFPFVFLLKKQKLCFGWLWGWKVEGSGGCHDG